MNRRTFLQSLAAIPLVGPVAAMAARQVEHERVWASCSYGMHLRDDGTYASFNTVNFHDKPMSLHEIQLQPFFRCVRVGDRIAMSRIDHSSDDACGMFWFTLCEE